MKKQEWLDFFMVNSSFLILHSNFEVRSLVRNATTQRGSAWADEGVRPSDARRVIRTGNVRPCAVIVPAITPSPTFKSNCSGPSALSTVNFDWGIGADFTARSGSVTW